MSVAVCWADLAIELSVIVNGRVLNHEVVGAIQTVSHHRVTRVSWYATVESWNQEENTI